MNTLVVKYKKDELETRNRIEVGFILGWSFRPYQPSLRSCHSLHRHHVLVHKNPQASQRQQILWALCHDDRENGGADDLFRRSSPGSLNVFRRLQVGPLTHDFTWRLMGVLNCLGIYRESVACSAWLIGRILQILHKKFYWIVFQTSHIVSQRGRGLGASTPHFLPGLTAKCTFFTSTCTVLFSILSNSK